MDLKEATIVVILDALNNNGGGIDYELIEELSTGKKKSLAIELMESDGFKELFTVALEDAISEELNNYPEEYGLI